MDVQRIPILLGPTASGKSALALAAAEAFDGTVINADSMQLYRELRLLTARPSVAEEARAPHSLYGILDGSDPCSAHRWRGLATEAIRETLAHGRLPILVGGTGFYIKAIAEGLSPMPEIPETVRTAVRRTIERDGAAASHARLAGIDPAAADRIAPADRQRIARALEVFEASGRPLSAWQAEPPAGPPPGLRFATAALIPPREMLVPRIEARFHAMMAEGALAEVEALLAKGLPADAPIMKAVGVPELGAILTGTATWEAGVANAITATRRYAKRQATWLKRQIISDISINEKYSEKSMDRFFAFIRSNALTP
ncbi:tRNA (adenosine(37)-N6)-dimethylallyltransferase MiaA [Marivibrio halodurans]|uniref:tRNA dimethylallyltransferase n=1 Tax=Marivibrio halodurans TaxID=2039722 RepID=A0A8J7RXC5_9PROT|nr:tRNA (adenosine(37)-N6)-dimethylallyltransferase MiaA [Marivibrio halodurans]MBP5856150.1 tRNA (adenosine(37)-N6)-dimethylallyltransferase MiaA [Marivibrio halodurans]